MLAWLTTTRSNAACFLSRRNRRLRRDRPTGSVLPLRPPRRRLHDLPDQALHADHLRTLVAHQQAPRRHPRQRGRNGVQPQQADRNAEGECVHVWSP